MERHRYSNDSKSDDQAKNTQLLYNEIKEASDIYKYLEKNTNALDKPDFHTYLNNLFIKKKMKKTQFIFLTGLTRSYIYAVLKGEKTPSREKVLIMIFGLSCNLDEAHKLLQYASHRPLYARDVRDAIVIFGIKQKMSLPEVNDILYDLDMEIID